MKPLRTTTHPQRASSSRGAASPPASAPAIDAAPDGATQRHREISARAYLRAAARGFTGERALDDWLEAEREVDARTAVTGSDPAVQPKSTTQR